MEILRIKESELKQITLFLIEQKIILHPTRSPKGQPDLTNLNGKRLATIIDRNILTHLIRLLTTGQLKDSFIRKEIGSLMLWAQFNDISINSGFALSEYAHGKKKNEEASAENNLFLKAFNFYPIQVWLDLALDRRKTIPVLSVENQIDYAFYEEYDHFKMHFLEMLVITRLFLDKEIEVESKFRIFHTWVYDNILICRYTTIYFALLLSGKLKTFNKVIPEYQSLVKKCKNQAWDLSYLSLWSTLYYDEGESDTIFLFSTFDNELKDIFMKTHEDSNEIYKELFGELTGTRIVDLMSEIYRPREIPKVEKMQLDDLIERELENLKEIIE